MVVISDEIRQDTRAHEEHLIAIGNINQGLAGRITYVLSPTRPATGVVFEARVDLADPVCAGNDRALGYARMSYQSGEIVGGTVIYCTQRVTAALISHELGHTTGLNHSPDSRDLMYRFITGIERFSRAESLSLGMLFERPGGNRFQDNDRDVAAASSGRRTTVCY